jgi:hypothetical protein
MDRLILKPTNLPSKKKPPTCQRIMIMERGNKDMEADVTMQSDDEAIRMENDQFMEDRSEHDHLRG